MRTTPKNATQDCVANNCLVTKDSDSQDPKTIDVFDPSDLSPAGHNATGHNATGHNATGHNTGICAAMKEDGTPCNVRVSAGSRFCFFHNPSEEAKAMRHAAQSAGGKKGKAAVLPPTTPDMILQTPRQVVCLLGKTINQVGRGELDPRTASVMGSLAGLLLKAIEQDEALQRLSRLENVLQVQASSATDLESLFDSELNDSELSDSELSDSDLNDGDLDDSERIRVSRVQRDQSDCPDTGGAA